MQEWKIVFYQSRRGDKPVEDFIDRLPEKDQDKVADYMDLLVERGMQLSQPYLKRMSGSDGVWELRPGKYRIFLSFLQQRKIVLIHMIVKKTQKTPQKDLKVTERRLREYIYG